MKAGRGIGASATGALLRLRLRLQNLEEPEPGAAIRQHARSLQTAQGCTIAGLRLTPARS